MNSLVFLGSADCRSDVGRALLCGLAILLASTLVAGTAFESYVGFLRASPEQRRAWMADEDVRAQMAKGGTPPKGASDAAVPRWYGGEGVRNFRDIGGWTGLDGRRVRMGRIFRTAHFGRVKDPAALLRECPIRTDLDLRHGKEIADLEGRSPLGDAVALRNASMPAYSGYDSPKTRARFAKVFRLFLDERNYPIAVHCAKGADRTGCVVCILNGLLGVSEDDLVLDWELTAFFNPNPKFAHGKRIDVFLETIRKEPGATLADKFAAYVKGCGFTDADVAKFRSLMLEEPPSAGDRPLLKVGIVADVHVKVDPSTQKPLLKAFERFAAENVRAVVVAGDICHEGELRELSAFTNVWHTAFPDGRNAAGEKVTPFVVFGNHDYHAASYMKGRPVTDEERQLGIAFNKDEAWRMLTGEDRFPGEVFSRTVAGFTFVGAHWGHEGETAVWLEAHAAELPRDRPIIYVQHPHPKNTCFGSWASGDSGSNRAALLKWPNLFAISGHSHISVGYDDALWQGGFCSMGAGSTLRTNGRKYEYNVPIGKRAAAKGEVRHMPPIPSGIGWQSTVLAIYPTRCVLSRFEHQFGEPLGEDWDLPFPFEHDPKSPYRIAAAASAPEFPEGATVRIQETGGLTYPAKQPVRQVRVEFPCAVAAGPHGRVIDYRVEVLRAANGERVLERLVQQEYATLSERRTREHAGWCAFGLDELPAGERLTVRVTPLNAGVKAGRPIEGIFPSW